MWYGPTMSRKMSITEFASRIGKNPETLRRWDRSGRLVAERDSLGRRVYDEDQIERARYGEEFRKDVAHMCDLHNEQTALGMVASNPDLYQRAEDVDTQPLPDDELCWISYLLTYNLGWDEALAQLLVARGVQHRERFGPDAPTMKASWAIEHLMSYPEKTDSQIATLQRAKVSVQARVHELEAQ